MTDFFDIDADSQAQRLAAAAQQALTNWNIVDAKLALIKYRENAVFSVEHDGPRRAIRLHRYGYHTDDELRSELQWMQALDDAGITVPGIVPTVAGELFVTHEAEGLPGPIQVDLFEWIDGEQLGSVEEGIADEASVVGMYRTIGELAAQVHNQAVSWRLPRGFTRHAWDAHGLAGEQPFWGQFWKLEAATDGERDLLTRGRDAVFDGLSGLAKSPGTYSMIHADFSPENIMVDGDRLRLIDFDDAGFGWHLFELVTSLYFIQGERYFEQAQEALIEGYRAHRQLADQQLELMPLFFLARGFTYLGWVHTRQETETARELTPMLVEMACGLADEYLSKN
ncbi:MAG: phosphotransferase [Woeseiaceae bacterium]|nr:phosphotransferase [Woeseiaceae bacterium]